MKIDSLLKEDSILEKETNLRASKKKLFLFSRRFSILLDMKIPIIEIINLLKERKEFKQLKPSLDKVSENLNNRMSVSEGFCDDKSFDMFFISMTKLGEESGRPDKMVCNLGKCYERTYSIDKEIQSAMIYPITLTVMGIAMLIFILKSVIPTFVDLFEGSDMVLPLSTRILISISDVINEKGLLVLIILVLIVAGLIIAYRKTKFGYYLDKFETTNPIFEKQRQIVISSEIAGSLSITHKDSMTILDGLVIIQKSMRDKYYKQELSNIFKEIESGEFTLEEAFNKGGVTPRVFSSMLKIAEDTGELGDTLEKLSELYDGEVEYAIRSFISMLGPILMIFIAIIVGFIVISTTVPIFDMMNSFN